MGRNNKAVTKVEYQKIKKSLRWNKRRGIELLALEFNRSPQTVLYIKATKDFDEYEEFKRIHNKRNPQSTLGKTVKAKGKRLGKVEAHLYGIGEVKASEL